jgi:hypothetical protein
MNGETLMLIGNIFIGIGIGIFVMAVIIYGIFKRFEVQLQTDMDEVLNKVQDQTMSIQVEKHNDTIFCFSEQDKQFICQGKNLDEIRQAFRSRFPDKTAFITGGDPEVIKLIVEQKETKPNIETT